MAARSPESSHDPTHEGTAKPTPSGRPRRRSVGRRILAVLLVLLIVLIAFVVLLPTLVNAGIGRGLILSAIAKRINGDVSLGDLSLSWTGAQQIRGFTITDDSGKPAITADLAVNRGLFSLITNRSDPLEIAIEGTARGEIREDGSTTFGDLIATDASKPDAPSQPRDAAPQPITLTGVPPTIVSIGSFKAEVLDRRTNQSITIDDVAGKLQYTPGGPTGADLSGRASGAYSGSFKLAANADNLFDAGGRMKPKGVPATLDLTMQGVPLPGVGIEGGAVIDDFRLAVSSSDLTELVQASIMSKATIAGREPSSIDGALSAEQILTPDGAIAFAADKVSGRITGERVPMAPFQPFLAASGVVLVRDVGELADFELSLARGEDMEVGIMARGDRADAEFAVDLDHPDGRMHLVGLTINAHPADPALVKALSGLDVATPVDAQLKLLDCAIPAADRAAGALDKREIGATGTLMVKGPAIVTLPGADPQPVSVSDVVVNLESPRLGDGMRVYGEAMVEGGAVTFDQTLTNVFDAEGRVAMAQATPVGRVNLNGLPRAVVRQFLPGQEAIIDEALGDVVNVDAVTSLSEGNLVATVKADSGAIDLEVKATRLPDSLRVEGTRIELPLTPRLAAALQQQPRPDASAPVAESPDQVAEPAEPISLLEPAIAQLVVEPFEISRSSDGSYDFNNLDLKSHVSVERLAAEHVPALAEPVALDNVQADVNVSRKGDVTSILAMGRTAVSRVMENDKVAGVRFDLALSMANGVPQPRAVIEARDVNVAALEPLLGQRPGRLTGVLGDTGNITASVEPLSLSSGNGGYRAAIDSDMPRLQGRLGAVMDEQFIDITAEEPRVVIAAKTIEDVLAARSAAGASNEPKSNDGTVIGSSIPSLGAQHAASSGSDAPPLLRVNEDLTLVPTIASLRLPLAMFRDEPFDPASVDVDVSLAGSPLSMTDAEGTSFSIADLKAAVTSDDLRQGVAYTLTGNVQTPLSAQAGAINVEGSVHDLVTESSTLARSAARVELNAKADMIPTALADSLGKMNGLLVAGLGETVNLSINARNFSQQSGALTSRLEAPNGWLDVQAKGRENGLRIAKNDAIKAELEVTPALRERLLAKVNPILGDIRTTKNPLTLSVSNAFVPLDGDISRLSADLELNIGEVELDGGSATLSLLKLVQQHERATNIAGYIEPIRATIREGIVTYERFAVDIDKFTLAYSGSVNLITQQVDLKTEIPLSGLAMSIEELEAVKDFNVPIVTRGTFGNLKTQIDPSFNPAEAAIQGGLGNYLQRGLDDLLNRDSDKDSDKDADKKKDDKKKDDGKKKGDKKKKDD
jgi:hypothetical protein